jgi:hypothetical protein
MEFEEPLVSADLPSDVEILELVSLPGMLLEDVTKVTELAPVL